MTIEMTHLPFYSIMYCIYPFLAFLSAWTFQKRSRLHHWYCVGVNTPKRDRQLRVKDLPKVLTWRLELDSNLRSSAQKAPNPTSATNEPPRPCVTIRPLILTISPLVRAVCVSRAREKLRHLPPLLFCLSVWLYGCLTVFVGLSVCRHRWRRIP